MWKQYILYIVVILLSLINIINSNNVSALSYQTSTNIGFTFLPTLNVSLSSNNLTINNLVPGGNAEDSNTITINVSTNIAEGYNLYATVGSDSSSGNNSNNDNNNNNTTNSNGYNTANLVSTVDNNYVFTPLSSNISELANFTNNTWGYSYSLGSGTTWISGDYDNASNGYNGLPLYTDTGIKLVEKADNTNSAVDFKIAARAGSTQPSGEYTNVINFTAISNTIPTTMLDAFIASGAQMYKGYFKMQDMTSEICKSIDVEESELQLIDIRDDKVYWVAKLKDNNCWMTQNLDLDLSSSVALTSETSDIDPESYGKTIYTTETGYNKDETTGIVSWLPSTIDGEGIQRADTIDMVWSSNTAATVPGWTNDNNKPYSANAGDRYRYTNPSTYNEANYASLEACSNNNDSDTVGCQHTHFGNYYNWSAAVASNNTANTSGSQLNSICPKKWKLPTNGKYGKLMLEQSVWSGNSSTDAYAADGFNRLRTDPLYFQRFGRVHNGSLRNLNGNGLYWSSTAYDGATSYNVNFDGGRIWVTNRYDGSTRGLGVSIRCVVNAD